MRILFLGNSHTYFHDMPALLCRFCRHAGLRADVTMLSHSARPLEWHRSEYFELRFNLLHGGYDFCVLQQQAHPMPPAETTRENLAALCALCRGGGAAPVVVTTWAEKVHPEHQAAMSALYPTLARDLGALSAPVGTVWGRLQAERPDIELYWHDGEHASPYGSYLFAAVLFSVLTGRPAADVPDSAIDFCPGGALDFARPALPEEAEAVWVRPRADWCAAIRQTADAVLGEIFQNR